MPTPTFDFDQLIEPVTPAEVEASIYQVLGVLGVDTTSWKSGSVAKTIIKGFSAVLGAFSELQAMIARSGFAELATGDWLTVVAYYVYQVERYPGTYATGFVTLTNTAGGIYDFDPGDLVFSNPATGKTYRNTAAVHLDSGTPSTPYTVTGVPIQAVEIGAASTSNGGQISHMVTTVTGVTVTNPASVVGQDAETDAAVRTRCSAKLGSLSPMGPSDAYSYAARNATREDGSNVGITRTRVERDGYGHVYLYVASASGAVPPEDVAIVQAAVEQNAEPLCVEAQTYSATPVTINITYTAWMYNTSGLTEDEIKVQISDHLTAWIKEQPIGGNVITGSSSGYIYKDKIIAVIGDALPQIFHVQLTTPASDVALLIYQVAMPGTPIGTIIQEPPPQGT